MGMLVQEAQREVRSVYLGGSIGQAVAGLIWVVSAACGTWLGPRPGILVLVVGGMFIFPLTQLALRLSGRRAVLGKENPLRGLAMQVAFVVPLALPVIGGATLHNVNWFYPAFLVIVGAHYLPFVFLYGMWQYGVLAGLMLAAGVGLGLLAPGSFSPGGWLGGAMLLLFAAWVALGLRREEG
jgi:hypothetical protein